MSEVRLRKSDQSGEVERLSPPAELAGALYAHTHFVHVRCYGPPTHDEVL